MNKLVNPAIIARSPLGPIFMAIALTVIVWLGAYSLTIAINSLD
jgi:hypothetical protein